MTPSNNFLTLLGGEARQVFPKSCLERTHSSNHSNKKADCPRWLLYINIKIHKDIVQIIDLFCLYFEKDFGNIKGTTDFSSTKNFQTLNHRSRLRFVANVISLPTAEDHACQADWG